MNDKGKHKTVDLADTVGAIHELPLQKTSTPQDLPEGWVWKTLGEISEKPQYGWTTKANHETGSLKLLRTTDITSGIINWSTVPYCTDEPDDIEKYLLKSGDILISRAGSIGVSFLMDKPKRAVFASYLIRFRIKDSCDKKYVYYYLKSPEYWAAIGASKVGIAVPNVNATKLAQVPIPIASELQQKLIVSEIEKQFSRLDEAVAGLKRIKANLKRYKASVLKAAVEGKLTEEWRSRRGVIHCALSKGIGDNQGVINHAPTKDETGADLLKRILAERKKKWEEANPKKEYKEPAAPDTSNLPELPKGWVWMNVGQISESMKNGIYKPRDSYSANGVACLRMYNIEDGRIVWKNIKRMTLSKGEIEEYKLLPGDLLVNRVNSRELVGKAAPIPEGLESCVFESKNIRVRFQNEFINTNFVSYIFSVYGQAFFNRNAQQVVGMASISQPQVSALPVPIPSFTEQKSIVEEVERCLSVTEEIEKTVETNLKRAERLRQAILKKAFSGGLV